MYNFKGGKSDASPDGRVIFRKGKEEAVGLSQNAVIQYALTDLQKELTEVLKEGGRVVFDSYQRGDLQIPELLSISHEILRMNFFIQKYTEEAEPDSKESSEGFFAKIKNLFGKSQPKSPKASQAEKFTQKREDLFQKLGNSAFDKYRNHEFNPAELETYYKHYMKIESKISQEKSRLS